MKAKTKIYFQYSTQYKTISRKWIVVLCCVIVFPSTRNKHKLQTQWIISSYLCNWTCIINFCYKFSIFFLPFSIYLNFSVIFIFCGKSFLFQKYENLFCSLRLFVYENFLVRDVLVVFWGTCIVQMGFMALMLCNVHEANFLRKCYGTK